MIEVKNLRKDFGNFTAVDDVSFKLNENEVVALLGLNGAGKTTTLQMLTGFLMPTAGDVLIDGISLRDEPSQLKRLIGYLPEKPALYLEMTVDEFLRYMLRLRLHTFTNEDLHVEKALRKAQILERRHQLIGSLSMGYKKRVGLAQALVHSPKILIFDEPIADLDPQQIIEIRNLILELKEDHTIILSSHILSEVGKTANRFLFIHEGKLVAEETEQTLHDRLQDHFQYLVEFKVLPQQAQFEEEEITALLKTKIIERFSVESIVCSVKNYWSIEVQSTTDIRAQISKVIFEQGWSLLKLEQKSSDLESLFLNLTINENHI